MNKLILLVAVLALTGCANMSDRGKQTAWIVGGIVVASIILSSDSDGGTVEKPCEPFIVASGGGGEVVGTTACN